MSSSTYQHFIKLFNSTDQHFIILFNSTYQHFIILFNSLNQKSINLRRRKLTLKTKCMPGVSRASVMIHAMTDVTLLLYPFSSSLTELANRLLGFSQASMAGLAVLSRFQSNL